VSVAAPSAPRTLGTGENATYVVRDDEVAAGSTLGGPRLCMTIKASGAIEKIFSVDAGAVLFGTLVLHFWDTSTSAKLLPLPGRFVIHPEHQEHFYDLPNHVSVHETLFAQLRAARWRGRPARRVLSRAAAQQRAGRRDDERLRVLSVTRAHAARCRREVRC